MSKLYQRIFLLCTSLLFCTSLVVLVFVWVATRDHAKQQASRDMAVAKEVLKSVLDSSEKQLLSTAEVLTADFGFKQSIASADRETVKSVLRNHGERINADLMAVLSLEGHIVASTSTVLSANTLFTPQSLVTLALNNDGAIAFVQYEERLFQVLLLTVKAPTTIAVALVGFEIGHDFIDELKNISKLDVTLLANTENTHILSISTLPDDRQKKLFIHQENKLLQLDTLKAEDNILIKQFSLFESKDLKVSVVLTKNLSSVFAELISLQKNIALITLVAITFAFFLAVMLSKRLTKPLYTLSVFAKDVAKGNYDKNIAELDSFEEVNDLSVSFNKMCKSIRERESEIQYQADHDLLTQLHNRFWASVFLKDIIDQGKPEQLFVFNATNLRSINDLFGYHNGDAYLKSLALRIQNLGGVSARVNGSELLWVPQRPVVYDEIHIIQHQLHRPHHIDGHIIHTKIAVAQLNFPEDIDHFDTLFRRLNITIDQAKQEPNLFKRYDPVLEETYLKRLKIITELKRALTESPSEFTLNYQPKMQLLCGEVKEAEALIRWQNPVLGPVFPDDFIPLAEQAGLIGTITQLVIKQTIKDITRWQQQGIELRVAINLSMQDILDDDVLKVTLDCLSKANLSAESLTFEITEGEVMRDPQKVIVCLNKFRTHGFSLAIDDFGTGYSSLAYLNNLPVQVLKIDKCFVLQLDTQKSDQQIVEVTIALAHRLGLEVVAEGVETSESMAYLKKWQCDWIQGYHLAKPMSFDIFTDWFIQNKETL